VVPAGPIAGTLHVSLCLANHRPSVNENFTFHRTPRAITATAAAAAVIGVASNWSCREEKRWRFIYNTIQYSLQCKMPMAPRSLCSQ